MKYAQSLVIACSVLFSAPLAAMAANDMPGLQGYVGKTTSEISSTLAKKGYEVRKVEKDDGYLEAYALKNGARYEIYVDPKSGKLVKIERD